jgi:hypothetical protein
MSLLVYALEFIMHDLITYVCPDMRFLRAVLAPSMMSISPLFGQSEPYIQTANRVRFESRRPG